MTLPVIIPQRVRIEEGYVESGYGREHAEWVRPDPEGNLFTSRLPNGEHVPMFDIDMLADLKPSKTPGHFHLTIAKPMKWRRYKRLLRAMVRAGIVEKEWYNLVVSRRQALLEVPLDTGVRK